MHQFLHALLVRKNPINMIFKHAIELLIKEIQDRRLVIIEKRLNELIIRKVLVKVRQHFRSPYYVSGTTVDEYSISEQHKKKVELLSDSIHRVGSGLPFARY